MAINYFYFLRHVEDRTIQSTSKNKWPLTNKGLENTFRLNKSLESLEFSKIFTSSFRMCEETISEIAQNRGITYKIHNALDDRTMTDKYHKSFSTSFQSSLERMDKVIHGTTNANIKLKEIMGFIQEMGHHYPGQNFLCCTHLQNMAILLRSVTKEIPDFSTWGFSHFLVFKYENSHLKFFNVSMTL